MKDKLEKLWEDERAKLRWLASQIVCCTQSLRLVCDEAEKGAKRELAGGEPFATIQVTPLQDSSTETLLAYIAEYNARLLWRNAIGKIMAEE